MKSGKYETRLADFGDKFVDHRKKLKLALSLHTAMVADATSHKLDDQGDRLRAIEEKLDMMALFRKLDTPREKDVQKFLDEHGGVKACLDSDELLEELVAKSGEASSRISGRDSGRRSNDLPDIRKKLRKELQEDIDDAFSRNMLLFERKLDIQSKQLTDVMQEESEHIISTLLSGAHDRITDPVSSMWHRPSLRACLTPYSNRTCKRSGKTWSVIAPRMRCPHWIDKEIFTGMERQRQSPAFRSCSSRLLHRKF